MCQSQTIHQERKNKSKQQLLTAMHLKRSIAGQTLIWDYRQVNRHTSEHNVDRSLTFPTNYKNVLTYLMTAAAAGAAEKHSRHY